VLETLSVPDFELAATGGGTFRMSEARGAPLVLYFYPKDDTPGCTEQGIQFRDLYPQFQDIGCKIYGVSRDTMKSHEKFKAKMTFPFDLLSDPDEHACTLFDVMKMKNMYGKQVRGIERSTFAIDRDGVVRREWRKVKIPDHADTVLQFVTTL
jgi:peroxiredoxin Q/BCP